MTTKLAPFDDPVTASSNFVLQWKDELATVTTADDNVVEFAELGRGCVFSKSHYKTRGLPRQARDNNQEIGNKEAFMQGAGSFSSTSEAMH